MSRPAGDAADTPVPPGRLSLTAVVCTYATERWAGLERAVTALAAERDVDQIVVVVDHDDALLARAQAAFPAALVIPNPHRRGLSGARNAGIAAAVGDVVAFVDDDAAPLPGWSARLLAAYGDDDVVAVGGGVEPAWCAARPAFLPPELDWVVGCGYAGLPTTSAPIRNPIGANMSLRRRAVEAAGGFDGDLGRVGRDGSGCEETELCIRLTSSLPGARVMYEPAARVVHQVSHDRCTWRYLRRRCLAEGRSKAAVARLAGARAGLASERHYLRATLPRALGREIRAARRDALALQRAAAIGVAVTCAAAAFAGESFRGWLRGAVRNSTIEEAP